MDRTSTGIATAISAAGEAVITGQMRRQITAEEEADSRAAEATTRGTVGKGSTTATPMADCWEEVLLRALCFRRRARGLMRSGIRRTSRRGQTEICPTNHQREAMGRSSSTDPRRGTTGAAAFSHHLLLLPTHPPACLIEATPTCTVPQTALRSTTRPNHTRRSSGRGAPPRPTPIPRITRAEVVPTGGIKEVRRRTLVAICDSRQSRQARRR
mmetsp:Transcript_7412/g.17885  ORF Transcript_7412/g.17885 Transcript_7412/m.17885 type:complete len:213 (-) Transcript_7412:107-745(-)